MNTTKPTIRKRGKRSDYRAVAMRLDDYKVVRDYCKAHGLVISDLLGVAGRYAVSEGWGK